VIGSESQQIITVNEDTLVVTRHPYAAVGLNVYNLFFPSLVAMANGKVLIIGQMEGIASNDILDGGQSLYEWDSNADTFTRIEPATTNDEAGWEVDSLARSSDHKWAVFSADQFYVYSSDTDSLTGYPPSSVSPPNGQIVGYALNGDGSKIAAVSPSQVTFLNRSMGVLGSATIPYQFQRGRSAVQFSPDGTRLFLQYDLPLAVEIVDASKYSALGYLFGDVDQFDDTFGRLLANDSSGHGYVGISGGLRILDLTQSPLPSPANSPGAPPWVPLGAEFPLNRAEQVQFQPAVSGVNIFVGGQPAPLLDGGTAISIPAISSAGPAPVEYIYPDGNVALLTDGASFGVEPTALTANLFPPTGNPTVQLYGYGFSASQSETPTVTVGGQNALKVTQVLRGGPSTLKLESVQIPNGSSGAPVDVKLTSSLGEGTLTSAASYYKSSTILPVTGLLQLTFDSRRNLLYALKANEVDILNPSTLIWQSPWKFPATATGTFDAMALTPDGSKLVVAGAAGTNAQLIVLDPTNLNPPAVFTDGASNGNFAGAPIAITEYNKVLVIGTSAVQFDLSNSTFTTLTTCCVPLIRTSADGAHLYGALLNESGGQVGSVDPSTYATQLVQFGYEFWTDLAVSPDGSKFAAIFAPPSQPGEYVGFFDSSLRYVNLSVYPDHIIPDDFGVVGATYSPGGTIVVVALGDSIELWDATAGTLRARLLTPEELNTIVYPEGAVAPQIALDSAGQTIFAISKSGLSAMTLNEPMDQIPPMNWPAVKKGDTASGGLHGSTVPGRAH
jgi:hypothetical protein